MHALLIVWFMGALADVGYYQDTPVQTHPSATKTPAKQDKPHAKKGKETKKAEAPPAKTEGEAVKPDDASKSADEADSKEEKVKPTTLLTDFGWAEWGLVGSERKFRQYATPPTGWFLRELRYAPVMNRADASMTLKSIGQPDFSADGRVALAYGGTIWEGLVTRNKFFEPTPAFIQESQRAVDRFTIRQSITPDFAVSIKYRKDEERQFFEPPRNPENQNIRYEDVMAAGRLGNGFLNLTLANWRYEDNLHSLPDAVGKSVNVGYLWEATPKVSLETQLSRLWLQQSDVPASRMDTIAVNGDVSLTPMTDVEMQWRSRHIDMPNTQSAWVREQRTGSLKVAHRWRGWTGQVGLKVLEAERIRGDQSYVDVPQWQTWEGKLTGRLNRNLRMTARGSRQILSNQPTMITNDPSSLYWNQRDLLQLKLDGGGTEANGYMTYSYRQWHNGGRGVDLTTHEMTLGGDWQVQPALNVYSELSYNLWSGSSPATDFPTFNLFMPNSRIFVLGMNWNINERTFLSFSYSDTTTMNENPLYLPNGNIHGSYVTITGRYILPNRGELGLVIAPWYYSDTVTNALNYNAATVLLTATARF